ILGVGDHEVHAVVVHEPLEPFAQQLASGTPDDVADEEQPHAAGLSGVVTGTRWARPRRSSSLGSTTVSSPDRSVARARARSNAPVRRTARAKRPKSRSTRW